jgi:subtilase family serine protease
VALSTGQAAAYHEFSLAGTSVSVQLIAGMQADAEQAAGVPIGFANPAVYARYGTGAYHDVTSTPTGPARTWTQSALQAHHNRAHRPRPTSSPSASTRP